MDKVVSNSNIKDKKFSVLVFFGFLVYPFITFLATLKFYKSKGFSNALWFLSAYFGYTMYVDDPIYDAYRYKYYFLDSLYFKGGFIDFIKASILNGDLDVYLAVFSYVTRFLSNDYQVFFALLGFVFGYFYSRNVGIVFEKYKTKGVYLIIFIVSILVLKSFWYLFGARFWTASHVFLFIVLQYFLKNKKCYVLLILLPFIHVAMLLPILLFISYILFFHKFKMQRTYVVLIFLFSLLMSVFMGDLVSLVIRFLPSEIGNRLAFYNSSSYRDFKSSAALSIFSILFIWIGKLYLLVSVYLISKYWVIIKQKGYEKFGLFLLFYLLVATFVSSIPILDRFWDVGLFLLVIFNSLMYCSSDMFKGNWLFKFNTVLLVGISAQNIFEYSMFFGQKFFMPFIFNFFELS